MACSLSVVALDAHRTQMLRSVRIRLTPSDQLTSTHREMVRYFGQPAAEHASRVRVQVHAPDCAATGSCRQLHHAKYGWHPLPCCTSGSDHHWGGSSGHSGTEHRERGLRGMGDHLRANWDAAQNGNIPGKRSPFMPTRVEYPGSPRNPPTLLGHLRLTNSHR